MLNQINHNEEQYIKARLDELPSWVFFPDIERAEWVNRIIKQAWPYANKYLDKAIFHDVMIPMIRGTSPILADFSFEKLDLGEIVCYKIIQFNYHAFCFSYYLATKNWRYKSLYRKYSRSSNDGY
jgi:hypothetical protein